MFYDNDMVWLVIDIGVFDTYYAKVVKWFIFIYCERELKCDGE